MKAITKGVLGVVPLLLPLAFHLQERTSYKEENIGGNEEEIKIIEDIVDKNIKPQEVKAIGETGEQGRRSRREVVATFAEPREGISFFGIPFSGAEEKIPKSADWRSLPSIRPAVAAKATEKEKLSKFGMSWGLSHAGYGTLTDFGEGSQFVFPHQQTALRIWKYLQQRLTLTEREKKILPQLVFFTHPHSHQHVSLWELLYLDFDLDENGVKRKVKDFFFTPQRRGDYYYKETGWNLNKWGPRHREILPSRYRGRSNIGYEELVLNNVFSQIKNLSFAEIFLELIKGGEGLFKDHALIEHTLYRGWGEQKNRIWDFLRNTAGRTVWNRRTGDREPQKGDALCWKGDHFLGNLPIEDIGRGGEREPCKKEENGVYLDNLREVFRFKKFLNISLFAPPPSLWGLEREKDFTVVLPMDNWMRGLSPEILGSRGTTMLDYYSRHGEVEAQVEAPNSFIHDPLSSLSPNFLKFLKGHAPNFDIPSLRVKRRNLIWLFIKTSMLENYAGEKAFKGGLLNEELFVELTLQGKEKAQEILAKIKEIIATNKEIIKKEAGTWFYDEKKPFVLAVEGGKRFTLNEGKGGNYYSREFGEKVIKPWEEALREFMVI